MPEDEITFCPHCIEEMDEFFDFFLNIFVLACPACNYKIVE